MKKLLHFLFLVSVFGVSQPSSEGMYFDGIDDFFDVPGTSNINSTTTNNRTYETYFKVTNTAPRQVIMEEGGGTRAVIFYVENGYLVVGAYNRADYDPRWQGTFYRKPISANTWYHFALVFDNAQPANATTNPMTTTANNALKWYLDGVLQDQISGYQFGPHNSTVLGFKDGSLRFPNCGTWTASGLSEHCFNSNVNDGGSGEYYFQGNLWGYRMWSDVRTITEINDNIDDIITTVGTDNLVAALDGDTFTYLDNSNNPVDLSIPNPTTPIIWSSTAATSDWNTGSNWVGGVVPNAARLEDAIIQVSTNYPVITSHVVAGDVQVQTGAEIIINDGGTMDVSYDLVNDGTITVNLYNADTNGGGSLLTREAKAVSGSGNFVINRETPDYPQDYYSIWSAPIFEADSQINTIFTNNIITYKYDASQNPSAYVQVNNAENMVTGQGYFIRSDSYTGALTRTFDGTINNGDLAHPIYYNGPTDNFNLIGNPYASALSWAEFYDDNSDVIEGTMYYWNQSQVGPNNSASDYISFNSTGSSEPGTTGDIATGLGVFVKSIQPGSVIFKNTHRVVGSNDQFFRSSSNPDDGKSWFRLTGSNGYSPILIGFVPGATNGYENTHDGIFVNEGASIEFYSFINSDKYEIQGREELQPNQSVQVQLGFQVTTAGDYTISRVLDYIPSEFEILLEDTLENTMTDLRTSDYTFYLSSPTEDNNRFIMHYNYGSILSLNDLVDDSKQVRSYFQGNDLITKANLGQEIKTIQVYDLTGKELLRSSYTENLNARNLSSGIYIVNYSLADSRIITKKVVKK